MLHGGLIGAMVARGGVCPPRLHSGTLDRGSGNPLNCDKIVVTTHHGYHIVAEDAEGAVLFSHQVNAQTGGSKQTLYLRHQLEHSEEL